MNFVRRFVFYGLLALIAIAPLPFGSNRPWAWSILSLWVGILVLLDAIATFADPVRGESRFMKRIAIPAVLFIPVVIWIVIQATPDILPAAAHPMWGEAAAQLGRDMAAYVSIDPELTRDALMVLLAYAGVFWLAARYGRDRGNAAIMLKFFVIVSTVYAIYGLTVFFGGWEKILWYDKTAYRGDLTSTFVNRNNYATYAAMGLVCAVALLTVVYKKAFSSSHSVSFKWHKKVEVLLTEALMPLLGIITNGVALILTHSRAGFVSGTVGIIALTASLYIIKILPGRLFVYLILGLFSFGMIGYLLSGERLEQRLENLVEDKSVRLVVYNKLLTSIKESDSAGYGHGYGSFEAAFRDLKSIDIADKNWKNAHNTYLELIFDLGVFAIIPVLLIMMVFLFRLVKGVIGRRRDHAYCLAGIGVMICISFHSLWDFSVEIVAIGISFLFVLSIGWAQSVSEQYKK